MNKAWDPRQHPSYDHEIEAQTRSAFVNCYPKHLTYDALMKAMAECPMTKAIAEERIAMVQRTAAPTFTAWTDAIKIEAQKAAANYRAALDLCETIVWTTFTKEEEVREGCRIQQEAVPRRTYDEVMRDVEYQRDPFWEGWRMNAVQAAAATDMDWEEGDDEGDDEEDEEDTSPGFPPIEATPSPDCAAVDVTPDQFPYVNSDSILKSDRCYFCASGRHIYRFIRSLDDSILTCARCLYDHLNFEPQADGSLVPVVRDT